MLNKRRALLFWLWRFYVFAARRPPRARHHADIGTFATSSAQSLPLIVARPHTFPRVVLIGGGLRSIVQFCFVTVPEGDARTRTATEVARGGEDEPRIRMAVLGLRRINEMATKTAAAAAQLCH